MLCEQLTVPVHEAATPLYGLVVGQPHTVAIQLPPCMTVYSRHGFPLQAAAAEAAQASAITSKKKDNHSKERLPAKGEACHARKRFKASMMSTITVAAVLVMAVCHKCIGMLC